MTLPNLDARAGLSPGSLLIKARRARSHRVIMVPPSEKPCHFQVVPVQPDGFALVRILQPNWPDRINTETLLEFDRKEDADEAFRLLEDTLVRDDDAPASEALGHTPEAGTQAPTGRRVQARWAPLVAAVLLCLLLFGTLIAIAVSNRTASTPTAATTGATANAMTSTAATPNTAASNTTASTAVPTRPTAPTVPVEQAAPAQPYGEAPAVPATPGDAFVEAANGDGR